MFSSLLNPHSRLLLAALSASPWLCLSVSLSLFSSTRFFLSGLCSLGIHLKAIIGAFPLSNRLHRRTRRHPPTASATPGDQDAAVPLFSNAAKVDAAPVDLNYMPRENGHEKTERIALPVMRDLWMSIETPGGYAIGQKVMGAVFKPCQPHDDVAALAFGPRKWLVSCGCDGKVSGDIGNSIFSTVVPETKSSRARTSITSHAGSQEFHIPSNDRSHFPTASTSFPSVVGFPARCFLAVVAEKSPGGKTAGLSCFISLPFRVIVCLTVMYPPWLAICLSIPRGDPLLPPLPCRCRILPMIVASYRDTAE